MPKAFWKGAISFGLVTIPVKMYVATETKTLRFHYLHKKDLVRPKQVLYCPADNEYFTRADTVSGYEYARGKYIVLTDEDLEKVPVRTAHTIAIMGFVRVQEIDPLYYYDTHYLEPEELAAKPFSLLREVLQKSERLGIAKVSFARREHLCSLRPMNDIMLLHTMHYQDEIRPSTELAPPKSEFRPEELEMANSLVRAMATSFKPEDYKDEYQAALQELVKAKIEGKEVEIAAPARAEMPDLMAALRASIQAAQQKTAPKETVTVK